MPTGEATCIPFAPPAVRASWKLPDLCVRLLRPKAHVQLAVHRRRVRDVFARLLTLVRTPVELAETEVTMRDERAHSENLSQPEPLSITRFRVGEAGAVAVRRTVTQKPERPRLVPSLSARHGEFKRLGRDLTCDVELLRVNGPQIRMLASSQICRARVKASTAFRRSPRARATRPPPWYA